MVVFVLNHFEQVVKKVLIGAALFPGVNAVLLLVVFLDLLHIKINFLLEKFVWVAAAVKPDFYQVFVSHDHFDKVHFALVGPHLFFALSEFQLG